MRGASGRIHVYGRRNGQGKDLNGLLGNGEWLDPLVIDPARERLEGWGQGGLGRRHADKSGAVAIKCVLWILEETSLLCSN